MNKNKTIHIETSISVPPSGVRGPFFLLLVSISAFAQTAQNITFPDIPVKGYGDTSFSLSATASSGLAVTYYSSNTAVATISGSTVTIKSTSGYAYISAYQAGNVTYAAATPVAQLLVVVPKATLTVIADNKSISAGTATPALTYTIAGYKKSETSSVVSGTAAIVSPGSNLAAGSYPIVINKGTLAATNYEFLLVDGLLTVTPNPNTLINPLCDTSLIRVFPNPANDMVRIESVDNEYVSVYDLVGNLVCREKSNNGVAEIALSRFPSGSYSVVVKKNNQQICQKLLIKH